MAVAFRQSQIPAGGQGELRRLRGELFDCFTRRGDALWELADALCTAVAVDGIAHLSLAAGAMRGHGSGYAALAHGRIDTGMLRDVLAGARPRQWGPDFAVDCSSWPRPGASCSPERGFYYDPSRSRAGQPVTAGWSYSWLVGLSPQRDSWTAPVDVTRLPLGADTNQFAVAQITGLLGRLQAGGRDPLFAFDAGYDPVRLTVGLAGTGAQALVRVRADRVFFGRPALTLGRNGRPPRHGPAFRLADPGTWPEPDARHDTVDDAHGRIQVRAWTHLHPKQDSYRDPDGAMTIVEGTIVCVQIERLPGHGGRTPKTLWLWHSGHRAEPDDLERWWRCYLRRFDIEHTLRFAKQTLGWTTPKVRTPEQADRWTWLVVIALTQLRAARFLVADHRLPWQAPQPADRMTPGRVRRGFGQLRHRIGTPASYPKPSTPGPGRPPGRRSPPAQRHPVTRKADVKPTKERTQR